MSRSSRSLALAAAVSIAATLTGCDVPRTEVTHYLTGDDWSIRRFQGGEPYGTWVVWWPEGLPRHEQHFEAGRRTGVWRTLAPDGALLLERRYADDELHGTWRRWAPDGTLREQGAFEGGLRQGLWQTFDADGTPLQETTYDRGRPAGGR